MAKTDLVLPMDFTPAPEPESSLEPPPATHKGRCKKCDDLKKRIGYYQKDHSRLKIEIRDLKARLDIQKLITQG